MKLRLMALVMALSLIGVGAAQANPIGGSATLSFDNGGTLSGFFEFDPTLFNPAQAVNTPFASWDFTTTDFGTTHHYSSANTTDGATGIVLSNSNNNQVFSFGQNFAVGSGQDRFELDIVASCGGTANCVQFGAQNLTFAVVGGSVPCAPGETKCISSGEQFTFGLGQHFLNSGVVNVTDPPNTLAFNVDSTIAPGFTLYTGGTGGNGGNGSAVPEPSSLLLLGSAVAGLGLWRKSKARS